MNNGQVETNQLHVSVLSTAQITNFSHNSILLLLLLHAPRRIYDSPCQWSLLHTKRGQMNSHNSPWFRLGGDRRRIEFSFIYVTWQIIFLNDTILWSYINKTFVIQVCGEEKWSIRIHIMQLLKCFMLTKGLYIRLYLKCAKSDNDSSFFTDFSYNERNLKHKQYITWHFFYFKNKSSLKL